MWCLTTLKESELAKESSGPVEKPATLHVRAAEQPGRPCRQPSLIIPNFTICFLKQFAICTMILMQYEVLVIYNCYLSFILDSACFI
jgi:hypothetical protein